MYRAKTKTSLACLLSHCFKARQIGTVKKSWLAPVFEPATVRLFHRLALSNNHLPHDFLFSLIAKISEIRFYMVVLRSSSKFHTNKFADSANDYYHHNGPRILKRP